MVSLDERIRLDVRTGRNRAVTMRIVDALPRLVEPQAVVRALQRIVNDLPITQRCRSMRATVRQGDCFTALQPIEGDWFAENFDARGSWRDILCPGVPSE